MSKHNNRFIKIGGGFFRETDQGLAAANDPQNLRKLFAGELPFEERESAGANFSSQVSQPSLTPTRTNALLPGGTPQATPQATPTRGNPFDNFNLLLLDALKKSQGVGTAELLQKQRALQRASLGRSSEITPEELRTLSPSQQSAIRNADVAALRPDIDEIAFKIEKAEQSLDGFSRAFDVASNLSAEFAEKLKAPESVISNAQEIVYNNPSQLNTVLANLKNDATRQEFFKTLDFTRLKEPSKGEERLSVAEAKELGVKFGTTRDEAANLGIVPSKGGAAPKTLETANGIFQWDPATSSWKDTGLEPAGELRPLPATQTVLLADGAFLPGILDELEQTVKDNANLIGPISGKVPFSEKREKIKDDFKRAAQLVGKFMEGGVLRKEDEIKYREMLSQLDDLNVNVSLDKLQGVRDMLEKKNQGYIQSFSAAGFDVTGFENFNFGGNELRSQVLQAGFDYDAMKSAGLSDEDIKDSVGL